MISVSEDDCAMRMVVTDHTRRLRWRVTDKQRRDWLMRDARRMTNMRREQLSVEWLNGRPRPGDAAWVPVRVGSVLRGVS